MTSWVAREAECVRCPLHESAHHVCLMGSGPRRTELMIIGEAPGRLEDKTGAPFVGDAGRLLGELLMQAGLSRDRSYITNAVKCRPPDNRDPKLQEMVACAPHLQREIDAVRPQYILLLGGVALKAVLGETGITKQRGRARYVRDTIVMPTLHPASAFYAEGNRAIIQQDLRYLHSIMVRGSIPREEEVNSVLVDTPELVEEMIEALTGVVAFDIETTDLYPWNGEITAFGFGTADTQYSLLAHHRESVWSPDDIDNILGRAVAKLNRCFVVGQNIKFDQLWVLVHYGLFIESDFDTMLAHYLLDENAFHDLEYLARLHFNAPAWDIPLVDKQGAASAEKLSRYLAHDVYYTRKLFKPLSEQLAKDRRLSKLYTHVLMPLANLFVRIEAHGTCIKEGRLDDAEIYLDEQIKKTARKLNEYGYINWRSTRSIAKLLYGPKHEGGLGLRCPLVTKNGAQSTAESALNMIDHPIIGALKDYRAAQQERSLFIKGWRPHIVPHRGTHRLHPNFKLHGTTTGRASAERPNLQQTTREPRVRSVITAPPGWQLMEADLSQIELRVIAHLSKDPTMLETFRTGGDIHWRTSMGEIERAGGGPYVEEVIRAAEMYCVQAKLPPNGASAKALLAVYQANHKRAGTRQIIRMASEAWSDQNAGSGIGREPTRRIKSILEGRLSDLAVEKVQEDVLRALRRCAEFGLASQKRKSMGLEPIEFADAMSLVSQAGPFSEEEGYSKIWKQLRYNAKAVGFGYCFGMWHKKFRLYARDTYGLDITERQAMESRQSFFQLYSHLEKWHNYQKRYVTEQGHVRGLDGQLRRLPAAQDRRDSPERQEAFRQAINSPVQGFASKINFMVLLQMAEEFSWSVFRPVATVHDAILAEVRDDHVEACASRVLEIMRRPTLFDVLDIELDVPIEGEVKIGPWGSGVSIDKWRKDKDAIL